MNYPIRINHKTENVLKLKSDFQISMPHTRFPHVKGDGTSAKSNRKIRKIRPCMYDKWKHWGKMCFLFSFVTLAAQGEETDESKEKRKEGRKKSQEKCPTDTWYACQRNISVLPETINASIWNNWVSRRETHHWYDFWLLGMLSQSIRHISAAYTASECKPPHLHLL